MNRLTRNLKIAVFLVLFLGIILGNSTKSKAFSKAQQKRIDSIYKVCKNNWDKYGVLPSVCMAQAMAESTMGEHCSGYNYWGIRSGRSRYSSREKGIIAYLKVINNGYYKGAPFQTNYKKQLRKIVNGGYCNPAGSYYKKTTRIVKKYNFQKYDKKMFQELKAKKQSFAKAKQTLSSQIHVN